MKESSVVRAYVSLAALSSLSPSPLPGSLVAPRYVAKEGGVSGGGCNGHVGAFLRASLVRCSVLTIQSRTAERARSPLHSALHSVFAAPRSGFVRNCMRRGGHASWASQSEESRRELGGNWYERQLPTSDDGGGYRSLPPTYGDIVVTEFARLILSLLHRERAPGRERKEEEGDDLKLPCSKV